MATTPLLSCVPWATNEGVDDSNGGVLELLLDSPVTNLGGYNTAATGKQSDKFYTSRYIVCSRGTSIFFV